MKKYLISAFFSLFSFFSHDVRAINLSPPVNNEALEIVKLYGSIPARRTVELFIHEHNLDKDEISSLYYNTISVGNQNHSHNILVGEAPFKEYLSKILTIYINKETKTINSIFIDNI